MGDKFLLMLPILDGEGAKKQLAGAAYRDFMAELGTMQTDLDHLTEEAAAHKVRAETVGRRLATYRELKAKALVYAELLDMQGEKIWQRVEKLTLQATHLLDSVCVSVSDPVGYQSAFDWDKAPEADSAGNQGHPGEGLELSA